MTHSEEGRTSYEAERESTVGALSEQEFRARFAIPDNVPIRLSSKHNPRTLLPPGKGLVFFTRGQFAAGLRLPLPSLVKQFLHFTKIPPAFLHPNAVRVLMGSCVLDQLHQLDLGLLEFLAVYAVKMIRKDCFSVAAQLPSLGFVTGLPTTSKGAAKGLVIAGGMWHGGYEGQGGEFAPNLSCELPGK